jgi:hypothetical protein
MKLHLIVRYIIILVLFLKLEYSFSQNFNDTYKVISLAKFEDKLQNAKKVATKRYVVLPLNVRRPSLVLNTAISEDSIFSACLELIFEKRLKSIDEVEKSSASKELIALATACYLLQKNQFENAISILANYPFQNYKYYHFLFWADCIYDTATENAVGKAIEVYQLAFDNTEDEILKDLVRHRINFIKYYEK